MDGKLYLNFSAAAREAWRRSSSEKIQKADKEWARLRPELR